MASPDELWLVDFGDLSPGEPASYRPALIVGPSRLFPDNLPFIIVMPLTTTRRGLLLHVEIEPSPANGLDETSYVQCELVRSINRRRLVSQLGRADGGVTYEASRILRTLLNF